jgi:hypothetical protein
MQCSHSLLAASHSKYAEPGSADVEKRFHLLRPRLSLNVQVDRSEKPIMRAKAVLSLCQPIRPPGLFRHQHLHAGKPASDVPNWEQVLDVGSV